MTQTMTATAHTVYAAFADAAQAERAAGALLDHGVRGEDISIVSTEGQVEYMRRMEDFTSEGAPLTAADLMPDSEMERTYVPMPIPDYPDAHSPDPLGVTTTTSGDAAAGAAKGAGFGLGLGALTALACLAVPGVGLVLGGGALATAIAATAGATAAGAVAGGIHGYLVDQNIPNDAVAQYTEAYHAGDTIVAVTVPSNDVSEWLVNAIFTKYEGCHVSSYRS